MKFLLSLAALIPLASAAVLVPTPGECPPKPETISELDAAAVSTSPFRANPKHSTRAHQPANLLGTPKSVQTDRQTYRQNTELDLCHGHMVDLLYSIAQGDLMP